MYTSILSSIIFSWIGSSSEQQGPSYQHSGWDSQPDVSWCPATNGPHVLPQHDLVRPSSDSPLSCLPLPHNGAVHLCWICRHGVDDSSERCSGYLEPEATGEADGTKGLEDKAGQWTIKWDQGTMLIMTVYCIIIRINVVLWLSIP